MRNAQDIRKARENHMPEGLVDRLMLNESRISGMAEGLRQIAGLEDPIGEVLSMKKRPNGLLIGEKRVPMGVIGIIYESQAKRDSGCLRLMLQGGKCCDLKGRKRCDPFQYWRSLWFCGRRWQPAGLPEDAIQLVESDRP